MLYFAYLPKTTIADIIPVLVASFDSNFVKPCTPKVANDGTLYYDKHERYVIEHSSHPLKFRSINWSSKKEVLSKFAQKNTFVGNYQDHTNILKDLPHKTITVTYNSGYSPLIYKQVEMFNKHHPAEFAIKQLDIVCNYDQPKADVSIDLVDL